MNASVKPARPPSVPVPEKCVTEEQRQIIAAGLRAFREQLAATPSRAVRVPPKPVQCPECGGRAQETTPVRTGITRIWTLGCGHGPFPPLEK